MLHVTDDNGVLVFSYMGDDEYFRINSCDVDSFKIKEIISFYVERMKELYDDSDELFDLCDDEFIVCLDYCNFNDKDLLCDFIKRIDDSIEIHVFDLNHKELISVFDRISLDDLNNVFIDYQKSSADASYSMYRNMIFELYKIIDDVDRYNLSCIEKIMYVYDIVKSKKYCDVDSSCDPMESRALHYVVNGDKIVCSGFSNMFNFIINELGIPVERIGIRYEGKDHGHQRSLVYVNDDKYDIEGLFQIDPTGDSNRGVDYINNYNFFLLGLSYISKMKPNEIFFEPNLELFKGFDEELKCLDINGISELLKCIRRLFSMASRNIDSNGNVLLESLTSDGKKRLKALYDECVDLLNNDIPVDVFAEALYNVRKLQYLNGIVDKIPSEDELRKVLTKKYGIQANVINNKEYTFFLGLDVSLVSYDFIDLKNNSEIEFIKVLKKIKK